MNSFNIYSQTATSYFGIIIAIIILLPSILMHLIFKPKFKKKDDKKLIYKSERIAKIIENISMIVVLLFLCISKNSFDLSKANIFFGIMLFFFILYYELFIRYIINGCAYKNLYKPFVYIKVPMAVFQGLGLIFASIWGSNIILFIASFVFSISNIYCEYQIYLRNYTEYRDLYDNNRKPVNKKILKDSRVPKGLNYITVSVFIYNKKNNKWLMQKRTKDKGGCWATTSGHPISGKSSIEGMISEIKEELGIKVEKEDLQLVTTVKRKDKFVDIYYLEKDINIDDLAIQKEELTDDTWMSENEIKKFYNMNKFKKSHYLYFEELTKHIKLDK